MTGISRINAIHISKDFAHIRMHGSRQRHCRSIRAAAAKGSHIAIGHQTLETGHNHDFALFQFPKHPVRFHIINRSLSISAAGYNACLGAGQGNRRNAQLFESHCHQRNGHLLSRSQEHIHFSAVIDRRNLGCQIQKIICGVPHGGYHDHDLIPRLPIAKNAVCNIQHFFRCSHRTSTELLNIKCHLHPSFTE